MRIRFTLSKNDGVAVADAETMTWRLRRQGTQVATGECNCMAGGAFEVDVPGVARLDTVIIECPGYRSGPWLVRNTVDMPDAVQLALAPVAAPVVAVVPAPVVVLAPRFDITANNTTDRDWLVWETEGNSDPKYQRGGRERRLGLYRLNYDLLRKDGADNWAAAHTDGTLGGGRVKIAVLDEMDYGEHSELIGALLPCFSVHGGKLVEPGVAVLRARAAISRALDGANAVNRVDTMPPMIVMPFNYDDNSARSKAIGKILTQGVLAVGEARRLRAELPRWATASRSTVTAFAPAKTDLAPHASNEWTLRPETEDDPDLPQVAGDPAASRFLAYQAEAANADSKYYSVKTGVDFVSTQSQRVNNKDLLESNSIHAMSRSNVIAGKTRKVGRGRFEARYQIEILSVLLGGGNAWDGIQIREIGDAGGGEVWFPALAIPCHGKVFAEAWSPGCDWVDFWTRNFATPLGRAKAEMLCYFGLQHMTSNAQNFLVAFDRARPASDARDVILRDIGDTILNTGVFDVLREIDGPLFGTTWDKEVADAENGIVLAAGAATIGGGYANPQITRIGAGIVFFFPPFLKGDVDTTADPAKAAIVGRWCLAHNEGFLAYLCDKVGYTTLWSAGPDVLDPGLGLAIRQSADLSISGKSQAYADLARDVLALSATTRQRLIGEIRYEAEHLVPAASADVLTMQKLVAAHELVICAEVHAYLASAEGKQALRELHAVGRAKPASGGAPKCSTCGTLRIGPAEGWYGCDTCRSLFCGRCGASLKYPPGTSPRMRALTEERSCGSANCKGMAAKIV